jgi:hypothetical protein
MLLGQTYKIYERQYQKNNNVNQGTTGKDLYAFRTDRATVDLIFGVRQLTEKNWENGREFLTVSIDYRKASDSVKRRNLEKLGKNRNCNRPFEKSEKYM